MRTIPELQEGTHRAKASGTLPNGKPVVVNADGTVSVVAGAEQSVGSVTQYNAGNSDYTSATFDSNSNRIVIAYKDAANSNYGTAVVGAISGTSISFGTKVTFESARADHIAITFDSTNNKVVIAYSDEGNSGYGTAIVGTVDPSDNSISFGSAAIFESAVTNETSVGFDANAGKCVIAYQDNGNSNRGTAVVATVSGTSISFGSATLFESGASFYMNVVYDSNAQKIVIAYMDQGNSSAVTAIVGTISGTSISFGSAAAVGDAGENVAAAFDSANNKVVVFFQSTNDSNGGRARVGTVSGTSITFGAKASYSTTAVTNQTAVFDSQANEVIIFYRDQGASNTYYPTFAAGATSGTTVSFTTPVVLNESNSTEFGSAFDSSNNKTVIAYKTSSTGKAQVVQLPSTNLTSENYIGMSQGGTVADGSSATVDIIGSLSTNQSGLTAGQSYYVQTDGTIGETAADPSVFAGTAISATSLVVKT